MRKKSNMGGGEFEFEPSKLDKRLVERKHRQESDVAMINRILDAHCKRYQADGLGNFENHKEYILQRLVKDFRGIK